MKIFRVRRYFVVVLLIPGQLGGAPPPQLQLLQYFPYFSLNLSSLCEIDIFKYGTCRTPQQAGGKTGGRSIETTVTKEKL